MFSRTDLDSIMSAEVSVAVSIYLPTDMKGREIRQGPIRLKNLTAAAEAELIEQGMSRQEAETVLQPARDLIPDEGFWRRANDGLAVFLAPDFAEIRTLPIAVTEAVHVGPRFLVRPVLPVLAADGRFFLLTITAKQARLFEASKHRLAEIDVPALPESVEAVAAESDYQQMAHAAPVARPHAGTPGGVPKAHVFGPDPEETRKAQLIEHLSRVDNAVRDFLAGDPSPLVLAAAPEVEGHFRNMTQTRNLLAETVQIDPEALSPDDLHERSYALVLPMLEEGMREALGRFRSLDGTGKASARPSEIVKASGDSRIDALLLAENGALWGSVTNEGEAPRAHAGSQNGDEDLTELAATQTLMHGGRVYQVPAETLPNGTAMAAVFRW